MLETLVSVSGVLKRWNIKPTLKSFYHLFFSIFCIATPRVGLRNFTLKRLPLLLIIWKFFFFAISHSRHMLMGLLIYVLLKTVSSLMTDWNVASIPECLCCLVQALIFFVLKIPVNVPFFTDLALLGLKLKGTLMQIWKSTNIFVFI